MPVTVDNDVVTAARKTSVVGLTERVGIAPADPATEVRHGGSGALPGRAGAHPSTDSRQNAVTVAFR